MIFLTSLWKPGGGTFNFVLQSTICTSLLLLENSDFISYSYQLFSQNVDLLVDRRGRNAAGSARANFTITVLKRSTSISPTLFNKRKYQFRAALGSSRNTCNNRKQTQHKSWLDFQPSGKNILSWPDGWRLNSTLVFVVTGPLWTLWPLYIFSDMFRPTLVFLKLWSI